MANTLQIKRGLESNLPRLAVGELAFTTDAGKFYVGDGTNNICLNDLGTAAKKDIGISTGNVVVVQSDGKIASVLMPDIQGLDASKLTGTISIERLPHGALERCVVVANDTARLALTAAQVQNGDTVKVTATGIMYFVMDETKLGQETAYQVYSAGTAAAVAWSGVTAKPTTLAGFGITDAVSSIAPTFTESPTAPTPSSNDNSTKLATTAFVKEQGYLKEILSFDCGTF